MALHGVRHVTLGVPDPDACVAFYDEFGLAPQGRAGLASGDGGEQLALVEAPRRRVEQIVLRGDAPRDERDVVDPATGVRFRVEVAPRVEHSPMPALVTNRPGVDARVGSRSPAILRDAAVRPRRLAHVALVSPDAPATIAFLVDALGFRISDEVPGAGAFLRCSTAHHDVAVFGGPVASLHHTAWLVDDVDEVGRGASALLERDPARHVWGLGRHWLGSNFFWYLRDPAGNFAEYSTDVDVITDDAAWRPTALADARALYAWGPPPPLEFVAPNDLHAAA